MSSPSESGKEILVKGGTTYSQINDQVAFPLESFPTKKWWACFLVAGGALIIWLFVVGSFVTKGQGVLGLNQPSGWGTAPHATDFL